MTADNKILDESTIMVTHFSELNLLFCLKEKKSGIQNKENSYVIFRRLLSNANDFIGMQLIFRVKHFKSIQFLLGELISFVL